VNLETVVVREFRCAVPGQITYLDVDIRISRDLPTIYGCRSRLFEALQNVIDNAVKYTGDQPEPCVEIGTRLYGGEKTCYVRDNEMGIEPQCQQKFSRLFDQLDQHAEGSGSGLALVKRIVEVHNGRIWVESEGAGKGSTFCFTIPSKDEVASHEGSGE